MLRVVLPFVISPQDVGVIAVVEDAYPERSRRVGLQVRHGRIASARQGHTQQLLTEGYTCAGTLWKWLSPDGRLQTGDGGTIPPGPCRARVQEEHVALDAHDEIKSLCASVWRGAVVWFRSG